MRFRLGLALGFALGYILGAKAGKERYEQIVKAFRGLTEIEGVQSATDKVKETVGEGMATASQLIRDRVET
ncbi:MAG: hypothetical protein GWP04_03125 [Gammaproteobacteria bacterium]|nr:hypothetical protein [Gammaproteobacteria bacterium]